MRELFAFFLILGCAFLVFGRGNLIMSKMKPVGRPRNGRTAAIVANGMARNFQTMALPMVIIAGTLVVIGSLGLVFTAH